MDHEKLREAIAHRWEDQVLPGLSGLIEIPAVSPAYDPGWAEHGYLDAAIGHVRRWADEVAPEGTRTEVLDGHSPVLIVDVPATPGAEDRGTVLLYGHLDKQPPLGDWSPGLGPWQPVRRDDRLYGRGAVDDGYAGYAALTALTALRASGGAHARAVVLLETAEESGSPGLDDHLDRLADRLGDVTLVIGLDSVGADDRRLWVTTSLRGAVGLTLTVRVLSAPIHSGIAGGLAADPVRIVRTLLDRVEDAATGELRLPSMNVAIPPARRAEAALLASLRPGQADHVPFAGTSRPLAGDDTELILNSTWRPAMTVVGQSGLPEAEGAGAVQRDAVSVRLFVRIPPTTPSAVAAEELVAALTTDVPYGASAEVTGVMGLNGWNAPEPPAWAGAALDATSRRVFGSGPAAIGVAGGIPFIEMLGRRYPDAAFVVTGACRLDSNMHVPDEWLDIPYARRVTEAVAGLLDAHAG